MKSLYLSFIALFFVACGSSKTTHYISKGYYIDSGVEGVDYVCGNQKGVTNKDGLFFYELNKSCSFKLADVRIKKISNSLLSKPNIKIYEDDEKIAQLLQTLDIDGEPKNGITISSDEKKIVSSSLYSLSDDDIQKLHKKLKTLDTYKGKFVSLEDAKKHLEDVENGTLGLIPVIKAPSTIVQNEILTLDASESKGEIESYKWKIGSKSYSGESVNVDTKELSIGNNTIKLTIKDKNDHEKFVTKSIEIKPAPTKWDNASDYSDTKSNTLKVTSDKDKIYFKYQLSSDINASDLDLYLNSDNETISGASSRGFDYKINSDGIFKLQSKDDYNGVLKSGSSFDYNGSTKELNIVIDKSSIEYLTKHIKFSIYSNGKLLVDDEDYEIKEYQAPVDRIPPIITIDGNKTIELNKGVDFSLPSYVSAYDIGDEKSVDVTVDKSKLDKTKAGYYSVYLYATDSKNNKAVATINVRIKGKINSNRLIKKDLGELNESVIIDPDSDLVWANDDTDTVNDQSTRGCLVIGSDATGIKELFINYCESSNYAGFNDWRTPTPLELSRYTIRMQKEGITPGMARKSCLRTIAITEDNSTVKSILTHNQKLTGLIKDAPIKPSGGRCVRGEIYHYSGVLTLKEILGGKVIEDDSNASHKLMWVSEYDSAKKACLAIHYNRVGDYNKSKDFCENLDYAGFNDWRDPNSKELSNFVKKSNEEYILPGYELSCKKLLARDIDGNKTVEKEVYTRFDPSHEIGEIGDLNISKSNIGLRCVRDMPN